MNADNGSYFLLAVVLTALFGVLTFLTWRSHGTGALLKGAGITLAPIALWLTYTLRLVADVVDDVGSWATALVFSPRVWVGLIVAAVAVMLFGAGLALGRRGGGAEERPVAPGRSGEKRRVSKSSDPEMDEIEAMLRRRGIS